jgi:hypothetical protein
VHIGFAPIDIFLDHAMLLSLAILLLGGIAIYLLKDAFGEETRKAEKVSVLLVSVSTLLLNYTVGYRHLEFNLACMLTGSATQLF